MAASDSRSILKPTFFRWVILALAVGTSWMLYLHRYTFALIKPELTKEFNLNAEQLGYMDSAFSLCYTLFQFPIGVGVDFFGVHAMLLALMAVWFAGFGMHAWAPRAEYLWIARAGFGIGQSAVFASVIRMTRMWCPPSVRSTLQGIAGVTAGRIGGLSAYLLVGTLLLGVLEIHWRTVVYLLIGMGFVQMALFAVLFRNSPKEHPLVNDAEADLIEGSSVAKSDSKRMGVRDMFGQMRLRALANLGCLNVQSILSTFADNIYSNWIPLFLWQVHGLRFKEMGFLSMLPLLGGAIAGFVGGGLNDWFIARTGNRRWTRTLVGLTGKGMASILIFAAIFLCYDNPYLFCIMLFWVKFFGDWSLTTTWSTVTDIGGKATASVFSFNNSVAGIGSILAPTIYGIIAFRFNWKLVFITAGVAYALCALSWLFVNCTIPILPNSKGESD